MKRQLHIEDLTIVKSYYQIFPKKKDVSLERNTTREKVYSKLRLKITATGEPFIIHNRDEIGQQTVDSKTDKYKHRIERLLQTIPKSRSLFSKSTLIAKTLNESGIEISERSVRNYIKKQETFQEGE